MYLACGLPYFIITGATKELLEERIQPLIEQFFQERELHLSPTKTVITHIEEGFDFLGQHIRKYEGQILIKPSPKRVKRFLQEIRECIKTHKQATAGHLLALLNPKLRGWTEYHRHVASKQTFTHVDSEVFHALWHWAKRRHPMKSTTWIKDKYFPPHQGNNWLFQGEFTNTGKPTKRIRLFQAASVPIRRHTKIRNEANPYDPAWERYFEQRQDAQMRETMQNKGMVMALWGEQKGKCLVCQQRFSRETGWESHHIVWKSHGGSDILANRVLLHPNCHHQVHCQGLFVSKPCPETGV
jgi:RNA-directed DNA polymerase